jgi:hypothetical protein
LEMYNHKKILMDPKEAGKLLSLYEQEHTTFGAYRMIWTSVITYYIGS